MERRRLRTSIRMDDSAIAGVLAGGAERVRADGPRPGEPEEIAQGVLFLAAPDNSFVNGHCLTIDGGWTAGYMM